MKVGGTLDPSGEAAEELCLPQVFVVEDAAGADLAGIVLRNLSHGQLILGGV